MKTAFSFVSFLILTSVLLNVFTIEAQCETLPEGEIVSYKSGEDTVSGFLVTPEGKGPFPAIAVIHEWWGLNDQIKGEAIKLAKEGYIALAVDLYRGKVTTDSEEAHELLRGLSEDRAVRDMLAAVSYLKTLPDLKKDKIGSIGWCMGGGYSLSLAINSPDLDASVIYYGRLVTDKEQLSRINAPVIGFFGEEDRGISPGSVKAFEKEMKALGKDVSVYIYPDAGHGFANKESRSYNAIAAEDAWKKVLAFFEKHLEE